jgi:hypothetical protein
MIKQYKYPQNSSKCQPENCCNIGIIDIHSTHIHDRWFSEMAYRWMFNDLWLVNCCGISVWQMTWICSVFSNHNLSFHHSWLITEFVTIVTQQVSLVKHSYFYYLWGSCFWVFSWLCSALQILICPFLAWSLHCLSFDPRLLIYPIGIIKLFLRYTFVFNRNPFWR